MRIHSAMRTGPLMLVLFAAAVARAGAPGDVVKTSGKISVDKAKAGGDFRLAVVIELAEKWHVMSNAVKKPYISTALTVKAPAGFTVGKSMYPKSKSIKVAGEDLQVFEGIVAVGATVKTAATVKPGKYTLEAELKYQACNDKSCLRPTTTKLSIPVDVVDKNGKSMPANATVFNKPPFRS